MRKKENTVDPELFMLYDELDAVKSRLEQAYLNFNYTSEPELIESCVYEINSLRAKYSYIMRRIKEKSQPEFIPDTIPHIETKEVST